MRTEKRLQINWLESREVRKFHIGTFNGVGEITFNNNHFFESGDVGEICW